MSSIYLRKIEVKLYVDIKVIQTKMQLTCSICYDDIEKTCNINSCSHIYCRTCITKWAREKTNTCPCCRRKFNVLTDTNGIIIDYFVDKENNDWVDLDVFWDAERFPFFGGFYGNRLCYSIMVLCWTVTFDEKIPYVTYHRRLNKSSRFMDMGHYQRELA